MSNQTTRSEFLLLGFSDVRELQILHFTVFLVIYLAALMGNLLIVTVITLDRHLHTPMYFFLGNLSILDLCFISVTVPKSMANSLTNTRWISFSGCVTQVFLVVCFAAAEMAFLTVMAYDRYVAICLPLRYREIMNRSACVQMAAGCWVSIWVFTLPFCGSNKINYFFCDIPPLIKLSCIDTSQYEMQLFSASILVIFTPFTLILVSYIFIISTILKIASAEGRHKAFSTCSSHLIVVTLYYGCSSLIYLRPNSINLPDSNKVLSLIYTTVTPTLNPFIYSLRNKEVKEALRRILGDMMKRKIFSHRK
uniref:Olfactory receptor n=1 Tax=Gopherus evgoodei TaxID=1825980 RepID=A0A8C4Y7H6_9SAUR